MRAPARDRRSTRRRRWPRLPAVPARVAVTRPASGCSTASRWCCWSARRSRSSSRPGSPRGPSTRSSAGGPDALARAGWHVGGHPRRLRRRLVDARAGPDHGAQRGPARAGAVSYALLRRLANLPLAWHEVYHSGEVQHRAQMASRALAGFTETQFVYLQNIVNIVGPLVALGSSHPRIGAAAAIGLSRWSPGDHRVRPAADGDRAARERSGAALLRRGSSISCRTSAPCSRCACRRPRARCSTLGSARVFAPLRESIRLTEGKWMSVDLLSVALTWSLVALYAWEAQRVATEAAVVVSLGSLFMVYQYAQQAGGVIGSMAAHLQGFARVRVDYASADPIWEAAERERVPGVDPGWREIRAAHLALVYVRNDGSRAGRAGRRSSRSAAASTSPSSVPPAAARARCCACWPASTSRATGTTRSTGGRRRACGTSRSIATLIPQEAEVFEASVRDNLTFGIAVPGRGDRARLPSRRLRRRARRPAAGARDADLRARLQSLRRPAPAARARARPARRRATAR